MLKYFIMVSTPSVASLATGFFSDWSSSSGGTESSSSACFGRSTLKVGSFDGLATGDGAATGVVDGLAGAADGAGYAT